MRKSQSLNITDRIEMIISTDSQDTLAILGTDEADIHIRKETLASGIVVQITDGDESSYTPTYSGEHSFMIEIKKDTQSNAL